MRKIHLLIIVVLISMTFAFTNVFSKESTDRRPAKEAWMLFTIQAAVESIDLKTREVTLRGPLGNLVTLEAGKRVKRLDEISVGDIVTTDYWTYLKAEFRDPTPEEMSNPLSYLAESGRAPEGMPPGAEVGAIVQAVVTIEAINREERKVTIKGPRGKYVTLPVKDQALLEDLKQGEVGIMTYAEALAISLEKVE